MNSVAKTLLLAGMAFAAANAASAQSRKIPITHDLRVMDQNRHNLWMLGIPPQRDDDIVTGSIGPDNSVTPTNPTGVVGFDGPPGIIGDSVLSYSPLPPGAPGNEYWR